MAAAAKKTLVQLYNENRYVDIYKQYKDSQLKPDSLVEIRKGSIKVCDSDALFMLLCRSIMDMTWYDDQRKVTDFFRLRDCWMPTEEDATVVNLTALEMLNCVRGAEFLLCSDLFTIKRDDVFIQRFKEFLKLMKARIYFLCSRELPVSIMDANEMYCQEVFMEKAKDQESSNADYESDDELVVKKIHIEDLSEFVTKKAKVTWEYIFEINTMLTAMDNILLKFGDRVYSEAPPSLVGRIRKISLDPIRRHIFQKCRDLNEDDLVKSRRIYYQDLICMDSYRRIYKRRFPHDFKAASRAVLVSKDPELLDEHIPTSYLDIITEASDKGIKEEMKRINTDALFFKWCGQFPNEDPTLVVAEFIHRDVLRNHWVVRYENYYYRATSYTASFALLRALMRWKNKSSIIKKVDTAKFDELFFPS